MVAVMYATAYAEAVVSLVLRGHHYHDPYGEIDYNEVYKRTLDFHPELYEELITPLSEEERKDIHGSYAKRLSCGDREVELAAMRIGGKWSGMLSQLVQEDGDSNVPMSEEEETRNMASTRVSFHYLAHKQWFKEIKYLEPEQLEKIRDVPCTIINGRYDMLCPPRGAWALHKSLPNSRLFLIPDAGHSAYVRERWFHCLICACTLTIDTRSQGYRTSLLRSVMSMQHSRFDHGNCRVIHKGSSFPYEDLKSDIDRFENHKINSKCFAFVSATAHVRKDYQGCLACAWFYNKTQDVVVLFDSIKQTNDKVKVTNETRMKRSGPLFIKRPLQEHL